ncbi:MAG TPA: DUF2089 domain-containing protein [Candidatus Cloacimonadota bacterium]|nr:DUF2089 domain-containing protein [Candidatus Cloacimonadota bacterium]
MKLNSCPVCQGQLKIRQYYCESCELSLEGDFESSWLEALNSEQLEFVRLFVTVQGNIKEMEKRLSISYPTVKNRLAEIINRIKGTEPVITDFNDIMNDLEEGFISVDEALNMIESRRTK